MTVYTLFRSIGLCAMSVVFAACGSNAAQNPTKPTPTPAVTVTSITVTSGVTTGVTFQLGAVARLSDNSMLDVTGTAGWDSSDSGVATVAPGGAVTIQNSGEVDLRATYGSMSGSTHAVVTRLFVERLVVTGAVSPAPFFQLTATASLSDGSTRDVTGAAAWTSSDTETAIVSSTGFVNVRAAGTVEIRAVYQAVTASSRVSVRLPPTFPVIGIVLASGTDGQPIAGAQVRLLESVRGNLTMTDGTGAFGFPAVTIGRHLLEVMKSGYEIVETEFFIVDRELLVNIVLRPISGPSGHQR